MEALVLSGSHQSDAPHISTFREVLNYESQVSCPLPGCEIEFTLPEESQYLLEHLLLRHRLVIADIERIASLADYVNYWRLKFADKGLPEYCTTMLVDTKSGDIVAKNQEYYLLSDVLPEDNQLRRDMQQKRLERILVQQKLEREDKTYERECLFCRNVIKGARSEFLVHLEEKHNFYIAKIDNLVFTADLIEILSEKLSKFICVYCEKIFKDRVILKEHMRKKGHKRINPNNKEYDVFFINNYLELGKNWQTYLKSIKTKKPKKKVTNNSDSRTKTGNESSSDSDSNWSDWNEKENMSIICFFCKHSESQYDEVVAHMNKEHKFDFRTLSKGYNYYDKLKMVNYIRRQIHFKKCIKCSDEFKESDSLLLHMSEENHFVLTDSSLWNQPEYYFPTYEDDGFLFYLEDEEETEENTLSMMINSTNLAEKSDINISEEVALSVLD